MENQIAWLTEAQRIEISDAPMPKIKEDEVLIQSCHVGICGSDAAFFQDPTLNGRFHPHLPIILGHECGGVVVEKGPNVTNVAVGDKIAVEPGVPCGKCEYCLSGRYNLCPDVNFMAATPFERGALCRYFAYPSRMVFRLTNNMTTLDGAMMEPLAVGMYAAKRGQVSFEKTIVILGSGCIGLMVLLACRSRGSTKIIVADMLENRLNLAKQLGAWRVINSSVVDTADAVLQLTNGIGADVIFEAIGSPITTALTSKLVKIGGRIVLVGQTHEPVSYDFFSVSRKEADIIGVFRYANMYPLARSAIAFGHTNVSSVVSHIFPFEDVQKAFETTIYNKREAVKVALAF